MSFSGIDQFLYYVSDGVQDSNVSPVLIASGAAVRVPPNFGSTAPPDLSNIDNSPIGVAYRVSAGELVDRITILQIKSNHCVDAGKLADIGHELANLVAARDRIVPRSVELTALAAELKAVNQALWEAESLVRQCEREQTFDSRFVELARSIYRKNDCRASIKRRINEQTGSGPIQEKVYSV